MNQPTRTFAARNLLLVGVLAITILFTAYHEGYLDIITWSFATVVAGGIAMMLWLALVASTARFLSLVTSIFAIEYVKEALGIRYGLWIYHGTNGAFVFGVWSWVLAGLTCYTLATRALAPMLRRLPHPRSHGWNPAIVIGFAVLGLALFGGRVHEVGWLFWALYLLLLLTGLWRSVLFDAPLLVGLVLASWIFSNLGEYLGSSASGIWTFPHDPTYPPAFLLFACWPIEIVAQIALATLLVPPSPSEAPIYGDCRADSQ